jgi:tricorn protease
MRFRQGIVILGLALAALARGAAPATALEECRLLRQPDIQGERIVFVYAGDLWTVARAGGLAQRLTSHDGAELFPKFSPDGKTVAFTGQYDGNTDVFTIPTEGGEPTRLTWHPGPDQVAEWYPDGRSILFRSGRASAPQRFDRFFKVPAHGGFEEMLPLPMGGYATFSADAGQIAYVYPAYDRRTWMRYRGGNAPDIWSYDFAKNVSERITDWKGPDEWPMWHGRTIYYASDRGGRTTNLWAYDLDKKTHRQVTHFDDFDVKWPSIGSDGLVFEKGGALFVMDLPGEKVAAVKVLVPDDRPATRAEFRNVSQWITDYDLSPSAKRVVFAARGDLFTVPAEKGDVRTLVATPGSRERNPAWSPDGKWVAYLSDQSGEYEVWVVGSDGRTAPRQVTRGADTFRFDLRWSPDSKKLAFSDKTRTLWWCDVETGRLTRADYCDAGEIHDYAWSGDSKWLAYSKNDAAGFGQLSLFSLDAGKPTLVTNGMTDDSDPAFDPDGKYLYFISRRTLNPQFGGFEQDFSYGATDKIYAMTLRDSLLTPVPPQSDEETGEKKPDADKSKDADGTKDAKGAAGGAAKPAAAADAVKKNVPPLRVDLDGIGRRVAELPVPAGRYGALAAFKGKLLFAAFEPAGPGAGNRPSVSVRMFDFEKRETKTILAGISGGAYSKDGGKVLYKSQETYGIVDAAENKKVGDGKLATDQLMTTVDPRREWRQIYDEVWRLERDFYYDPDMGGLDWKAVGDHYRQLLPYVGHRSDLDYVLGELQGELSTSHTYVRPTGDIPQAPRVDVGLLGADYALDEKSGLYRFQRIYGARDWNSSVEAPLGMPGILVREGDYLLTVNGQPVKAPMNLYAAFQGTTGRQTLLTVGRTPDDPSPRSYTVKPIASEASLRYTAWVEANREKVAKATGGRVAYIHVPDTTVPGIQEFTKQYYPQVDKQGIIVDERFNAGGQVPYFYTEKLARKTLVLWSNRDGRDQRTPAASIDGPKCILINQFAGSGGDAFPYFFRAQGIGPLIGERTWGGLVGYSHDLPLVDGGGVTMPDFGMWDPFQGKWAVENYGVDPDIQVENTPSDVVAGHDAQLERAIQWSLEQLEKNPPKKFERPKYKVQEGLK